jgi:hypothetical protein
MEANDVWRHKSYHDIEYHTLPREEAEEGQRKMRQEKILPTHKFLPEVDKSNGW